MQVLNLCLCPNPKLPEEEELSEGEGPTDLSPVQAACLLELHPQMPRKQPAGCIFLLTFLCLSGLVGAVTRTYYIGIVEEYWNYVPQGKNVITGKSFTEDKWVNLGSSLTPRFGLFLTLHGEVCISWVLVIGVSWSRPREDVLFLCLKIPSMDGCVIWKRYS